MWCLSQRFLIFPDIFGEAAHLKSALQTDGSLGEFMEAVVAPALGIEESATYESGRAALVSAFADSYMASAVSMGKASSFN